MRGRPLSVALVVCLLAACALAFGSPGLFITGGVAATDLVNTLVGTGGGVSVSNITYAGAPEAAGTFSGGTGILGFEDGIVLGSGYVVDGVGPNDQDGTTGEFGTPGDPELDLIVEPFGTWTYDAAVLEFDFECPGVNGVSFDYVFTSEEYNEYTNSVYTNVFAFYLNGTNIALLPDGVTDVQINTVNGGYSGAPYWGDCMDGVDNDGDGLIDGADPDCTVPLDNIIGEANSNSEYFINNDCQDPDGGTPCPIDIEADGLTVVLTAQGFINPGLNHIKLAIADAGDAILDSWVFIEGGSFQCVELQGPIDIKPGSYPNSINPKSKGRIPVGIFSNDDLDALTIDQNPAALTFGRTGDEISLAFCNSNGEDLNGDGLLDLVCHFNTRDTGFVKGDEVGILKGVAPGYGGFVFGDSVRILGR